MNNRLCGGKHAGAWTSGTTKPNKHNRYLNGLTCPTALCHHLTEMLFKRYVAQHFKYPLFLGTGETFCRNLTMTNDSSHCNGKKALPFS